MMLKYYLHIHQLVAGICHEIMQSPHSKEGFERFVQHLQNFSHAPLTKEDIPIEEVESLSPKTRKTLKRAGIKSLRGLLHTQDSQLQSIKNIGEKTIGEIRAIKAASEGK